jgi:hypothetical protein
MRNYHCPSIMYGLFSQRTQNAPPWVFELLSLYGTSIPGVTSVPVPLYIWGGQKVTVPRTIRIYMYAMCCRTL